MASVQWLLLYLKDYHFADQCEDCLALFGNFWTSIERGT
jgi:hypothetical protein